MDVINLIVLVYIIKFYNWGFGAFGIQLLENKVNVGLLIFREHNFVVLTTNGIEWAFEFVDKLDCS